MEIAAGVYVGRVSARVRDKLWERVVETCKGGRAVLVFNANTEQRMDFRIHGETWEPIDFDGLKLMLRPSSARRVASKSKQVSDKKAGFSNASKFQKAKKYSTSRDSSRALPSSKVEVLATPENQSLNTYVVIDLETTGLRPTDDEITEIGALKVEDGQIAEIYQSYIKVRTPVPSAITELTGITNTILAEQGKSLDSVMDELLSFLGGLPIVMHNASFDMSFLNAALSKCGHSRLSNSTKDTLEMAKKVSRKFTNYKLKNLAEELSVDFEQLERQGYKLHRSMGDCYLTHLLFQKLINLEK
jgi:CRISPR-associated protein Cas2